MGNQRRLLDEYRFDGFRPRADIVGVFGDSMARVIRLDRTQKKRSAVYAARCIELTTTGRCAAYATCHAGLREYICRQKFGGSIAGSAAR